MGKNDNGRQKKNTAAANAAEQGAAPRGMSPNQQKLEELRLQREVLELEDLNNRVQAERDRRAAIIHAHKQQQESLDSSNREKANIQANCSHKGGGMDIEGFWNGDDPSYCIIRHTYPAGDVGVICTRCNKEWWKPSEELRKANPKLAKEMEAEFKMVMKWPTKNTPSGTQLFLITKTPPTAQVGA
jgi:hypothetical protein